MKKRIIGIIMLVILLVSSVAVVSAEHEYSIYNTSTKTFSQGTKKGYSTSPGEKGNNWFVEIDCQNHCVGAVFLKGTDTLASALWCFDNCYGYSDYHPYKKAYENKKKDVVWKMRRDNDKKYAKEGFMSAEGTFFSGMY